MARTVFVFNEGLQKLLREATETRDFDDEALMMAKLVKTIRKDMSDWNGYEFKGDCKGLKSALTALKAFVSMLLNEPNAQNQDIEVSQAYLTIA